MIRQQVLGRGLAVALIAAASACGGESATSPGGGTGPPVELRKGGWSDKKGQKDTYTTTFVVHPNKDTKLTINGGHMVFISAGAICELATSGYGPGTWETPCEPQKQSVTVTAYSWTDANDHPRVQFSPDMRFTPDDAKPAWLVMYDKTAAKDSTFKIMYCPTLEDVCIDESLADPEVVTRADKKNQFLYRRVKHFSGYNVTTGTTAEAY